MLNRKFAIMKVEEFNWLCKIVSWELLQPHEGAYEDVKIIG